MNPGKNVTTTLTGELANVICSGVNNFSTLRLRDTEKAQQLVALYRLEGNREQPEISYSDYFTETLTSQLMGNHHQDRLMAIMLRDVLESYEPFLDLVFDELKSKGAAA